MCVFYQPEFFQILQYQHTRIMKRNGIDFVYAPKGDAMIETGISQVSVIGFKNDLFIIPWQSIAGAGRDITTTTFYADGRPVPDALQAWIDDSNMSAEDLRQRLLALVGDNAQLYIKVNELAELKVRASWLSKGVYYKHQGKSGFRGCAIRSKEVALQFKAFYGV